MTDSPGQPTATLTPEETAKLTFYWHTVFGYGSTDPLGATDREPVYRRSHEQGFAILAGHVARGVDVRSLAEVLSLPPEVIESCVARAHAQRAEVVATQDRLGITELIAPLRTHDGAAEFLFACVEAGCGREWGEAVTVAINASLSISRQPDYDDYDDLGEEAWDAVKETVTDVADRIGNRIADDRDIAVLAMWYARRPLNSKGTLDGVPLNEWDEIHQAFMVAALDIAEMVIRHAVGAASVRHLIDDETYDILTAPLIRAREEQP
ncbi:hypothetical protein [Streptomyces xiamenensis]|uniref:hypothetical protein n=1 Tax=Streptomyces xiamenensis TaxID=408015 RepID=UPI0037CD17D1